MIFEAARIEIVTLFIRFRSTAQSVCTEPGISGRQKSLIKAPHRFWTRGLIAPKPSHVILGRLSDSWGVVLNSIQRGTTTRTMYLNVRKGKRQENF